MSKGRTRWILLLASALSVWALAQPAPPPSSTPETPPSSSAPDAPEPDVPADLEPIAEGGAAPSSAPATDLTAPVDPAHPPVSPPVSTPATPPDAPPEGDTRSRTTLERKDKIIEILKTTADDKIGLVVICGVGDTEDSPTRLIYYDPSPTGVQVTIEKNVITAALSEVLKKSGGDGNIEMSAGRASIGENDACATTEAAPTPGTLKVVQGKTNLSGSRLTYSETDGLAKIDGPIVFNRTDEKNPISGSSEEIVVDVDNSVTKLVGKVSITSGKRVSKAQSMEYDDAKNLAVLYGTCDKPATSAVGNEPGLKAVRLIYHLDTNNVESGDKKSKCILQGEIDIGE